MSKGDTFENDLLLLIFNNTNAANIGDATGLRGSSTAGSLYLALHTADPTDSGSQTSSESAYTNYVRVAVARSGAGFTVSGNSVTLAATASFASSGASGTTITHFSVGVASAGASKALYIGTVTPNITIGSSGVVPQLTTGTTITED